VGVISCIVVFLASDWPFTLSKSACKTLFHERQDKSIVSSLASYVLYFFHRPYRLVHTLSSSPVHTCSVHNTCSSRQIISKMPQPIQQQLSSLPVATSHSDTPTPSTLIKKSARKLTFPSSPRILSRLSILQSTLPQISHDLCTRIFFINIQSHDQYFCAECTRLSLPQTSCGPACPLLRPLDKQILRPLPMSPGWEHRVLADADKYRKLCDSIERRGCNVSHERLGNWERVVKKLKSKGLNLSEKEEERGWSGVPPIMGTEIKGWTLEGRWGAQTAVEEEAIPPNVNLKVVRRRVKVVKKTLETKTRSRRVKKQKNRALASK
jgi:hypothetical protein